MASHSLNDHTIGHHAAPVTAYLDDLSGRLVGPRRRRAQVLSELRDGLIHVTGTNLAAGMPAHQAQATAVAQFGSPQSVADAFAGELATAYARRTVALYVLSGPLVGMWWLLLTHAQPWRTGLIALLAAIPVLPIIAVAIATAGATLATTGRLMRWLPEATPRRTLTATTLIAGLAIAGDLTMVGLFLTSATPLRLLSAVAIAASTVRTGWGITVIRTAALIGRRMRTSG